MQEIEGLNDNDGLRARAVRRLKKKQDLKAHLLIYLMVNTCLVVIWAMTDGAFFWPVFPIVFWGIGLVMNMWDVYRREQPSEERIRQEMERLQTR